MLILQWGSYCGAGMGGGGGGGERVLEGAEEEEACVAAEIINYSALHGSILEK